MLADVKREVLNGGSNVRPTVKHEVTIAWRQHRGARSITAPGTLPEGQHGRARCSAGALTYSQLLHDLIFGISSSGSFSFRALPAVRSRICQIVTTDLS